MSLANATIALLWTSHGSVVVKEEEEEEKAAMEEGGRCVYEFWLV